MTAQQAINRSISHSEIVTLDYDATALDELTSATRDYVTGNSRWEFWGEHDGNEWRVHMHFPVQVT